jgi:protein-S-isoprenylcysteine O-methyltransferase Ste14
VGRARVRFGRMHVESGFPAAQQPRSQRFVAATAVNAALAFLWALFAVRHVSFWLTTGNPRVLPFVFLEGLIAALFLIRRDALSVVTSPGALAATLVGTFAPLAVAPADLDLRLAPLWSAVQILGVGCAVASAAYLGRSFGLVPANRGVQTRGPYRLVRHPLYAAYAVTWVGYLGLNPTTRNAILLAAAGSAQLVRIALEERVLLKDSEYAAYAARVRYRLLPRIF